MFEKDSIVKYECIRYVDSDYAGDLDKHQFTTRYLFTLAQSPMIGALFYSLLSIVFYKDRVYGHDEGYEGGNLSSRVV